MHNKWNCKKKYLYLPNDVGCTCELCSVAVLIEKQKPRKTCTTCKKEFTLDNFYKDNHTKTGITGSCKNCLKDRVKKFIAENKEEYKKKYKIYNDNKRNSEKRRIWRRAYIKRNTDQRFRKKIANKIRKRLQSKNGVATTKFLGCSVNEFKAHLAAKFQPGMSWENYGTVWHMDHIIPCAAFEPTIEEMKKCWHYTNIQPLFVEDNRAKSNIVDGIKLHYKNKLAPISEIQATKPPSIS